jgi:hypothetical protein
VPNENIKGSGKSGASGSKGSNWNKPLSPEEVNAAESSAGGFADYDKTPYRNGLRLVPGGKTEETEAPGGSKAKSDSDVASEADSNGNDKNGSDNSTTDRVGKGFSPAAMAGGEVAMAKQALKLVLRAVGKHKKGFLAGGGIIGIIVAAILLVFSFVLSHELLTIEADLLREFTKIEQHFEKEEDQTMMQHLACRVMPASCPASKDPKDPADEKGGGDTGDNHPLGEDMDKFSFEDPTIKDALAKQDIDVSAADAAGDITLTDEDTGELVTPEDIASDSSLANRIQEAVPEESVGDMEDFVGVAEKNADATFAGAPDTDQDNTPQTIEDDVSEGNAGENAVDSTISDSSTNPTESSTTGKPLGGELGEATDAAETALKDGESVTQATQTGVDDLLGQEGAEEAASEEDIAADAAIACSYEKAIKTAAKDRIPTIVSLLIRHGATLLSLADQLKSGHITGNEVNSTMEMLNGNPSAKVSNTDKGTANDDTLPFSASATWQQAIGNPNAAASPSILASALPTSNGAQAVFDDLDSIVQDTGMGHVCSILTSPFSIVLQLGVGLGELVTNIGDFGATEFAQATASTAFILTMQYKVLPEIIQYFTPINLSGAENSVQFMNNSGAGINLASNDYARSLGGEPLSDSDADSIAMESTQEDQIAEANLPWTQRVFSMDNPNSLISNIALDMPVSLGQTVSKVGDYFMQLPSALMRAVGSIFSGHIALAQSADSNPGTLYGVTQYGFTDSELTAQQDPIVNEQYLYSDVDVPAQICTPVTTTVTTTVNKVVTKKTVTTTTCVPTTYPVQRIAALGNPNTATVQADYNGIVGNSVELNTTEPQWQNGDTTTKEDLLHCFDDGYTALQENIAQADTNCGGLGSYDSASTGSNASGANDPYAGLPSGNTVAQIYCSVAPPPLPSPQYWKFYPNCADMISGQTANDVTNFRQYLLDLDVMNNYMGLTN